MNTITLATLHEATAQQVFDQAARHLLTQGRKSLADTDETFCAYRGTDGLKCAAGCFIADNEYRNDFEGERWDLLSEAELVPTTHSNLIRALQAVHDGKDCHDWKRALVDLADSYGLSTDVLTEFAP